MPQCTSSPESEQKAPRPIRLADVVEVSTFLRSARDLLARLDPCGRILLPREELSRLVGIGLERAPAWFSIETPPEIPAPGYGRPAGLRPALHGQDSGRPGGGAS